MSICKDCKWSELREYGYYCLLFRGVFSFKRNECEKYIKDDKKKGRRG